MLVKTNKAQVYCKHKTEFKMESYLTQVTTTSHRRASIKLRLNDHILDIESGRHVRSKINRENRTCRLCGKPDKQVWSQIVDDIRNCFCGVNFSCHGVASSLNVGWETLVTRWPSFVMEWSSLVREWQSSVMAWSCLVVGWPSFVMAWSCLVMPWPSLVMVWLSLVIEWPSLLWLWRGHL